MATVTVDVKSPGNGPEKKEKVKQMIKDALPDEQWKIDPEFFTSSWMY